VLGWVVGGVDDARVENPKPVCCPDPKFDPVLPKLKYPGDEPGEADGVFPNTDPEKSPALIGCEEPKLKGCEEGVRVKLVDPNKGASTRSIEGNEENCFGLRCGVEDGVEPKLPHILLLPPTGSATR